MSSMTNDNSPAGANDGDVTPWGPTTPLLDRAALEAAAEEMDEAEMQRAAAYEQARAIVYQTRTLLAQALEVCNTPLSDVRQAARAVQVTMAAAAALVQQLDALEKLEEGGV